MKKPFYRITDARTRWTAIILLLFVIGMVIYFGYRYRLLQLDDPRGGNLFVFFLININVLLLTTLIFLLARNAIKLFYEGRKKVFGYHLRTKLVLIFVGFSLIPTLLLFVVAEGFISDSIEYWFNLDVDRVVEGSVTVSQDYYTTMTDRVRVSAQRVADRLGEVKGGPGLDDVLERLRRDYSLSDIELFNAEGEPIARSWDGVSPQGITSRDSSLVQNAQVGRVIDGIERAEKGEFIKGAAPVRIPGGQGAVIVTLHMPEAMRITVEDLAKTYRSYTEMKLLKRPIRANYKMYLLLLAMLILFSASWLGFYLARGITVPIGKLAEGAEKVAEGDLSARVDIQATDEIGILVEAFNNMTAELETGRKRLELAHGDLELAYLENEQRRTYIETVLKNVGTGVVSIDLQGRINTYNSAAEVMFSVKPDEVLGREYNQVLSPEHIRVVDMMFKEVGKSRDKSVRREIPIVVRGRPMILLVNISMLHDVDGETIGYVLVLEDMTKLVNAQKKAAWSEVAKRIAHEIKNPLTPIKLSAERIRKRLQDNLDEEEGRILRESIDSIIREVEGMKGLVNEFSQFARLPVLNPVVGDINETVQDAVLPYQHSRLSHERIILDLENNLPVISFDREQIHRVMINLVENAIKAVEDRGEGTVAVSTRVLKDLGIVEIKISDEGVGVPVEYRERIFEPYYTTREKGTGLGLAITKRIIEEHGGVISYRENNPIGSVFSVRIPVDIDPGRPV
ncbi:HAMP domain-containing protein [bacterium]|nr:MAG: HAMP domain-containing protein [bacterium]